MPRRLLAFLLYWLCWAIDRLPWKDSIDHRWYFPGQHGCVLGISRKAACIEDGLPIFSKDRA